MKYVLLSVFLLHGVLNYAQEITGTQLLERAIAYHDPENNWSSFKGKMLIEMENPKSSPRSTVIEMKLPNNYFKSTVKKDNYTIESELDNGE
ncbi:MAG: DUF6503 family protein, partial [Maribacter dokdonensis]